MKRRPIVEKAKSIALAKAQNFHGGERSSSEIAVSRADLHTKIALALICGLLFLNFMLRFPELGAVIAQYSQF